MFWNNKSSGKSDSKEENKNIKENVNQPKEGVKSSEPRKPRVSQPRTNSEPQATRQKSSRPDNSRPRVYKPRSKNFNNEAKKENVKSNVTNFSSKLKVIPLGGLDEIGKNCAVIQYDDEMVVVDMGLAFPDEDMPGVNLVVPDFSYINKNIDKLKAIAITHAHEDHIGSLGHFLKFTNKKNVPIYSSKFTLGIIREKLKEKFRNKKFDLQEVESRSLVSVGKHIKLEFINITHSIPGAFAVAIHTPEGTIVHTGDYKFDLTPVDGRRADFYKLAEIGEKGALLLLSDSTNATKEGFTPSELSVVKSFEDVLHKSKGRVIVASFASHAHRVQEMIKVGHKFNRKCALDGRSMHRAFDIGQETGSVIVPEGSVVPLSQTPGLKEEEVLIICTGTQGELMSALSRASRNQHRDIKIEAGDSVIMSANSIPGNEVSINRVTNALVKKGAKVYRHGEGGLHVSGHGRRGDIALMLNLIKPKFFMPVHGEYMHLSASKSLAVDFGLETQNVVITKNGDVVSLNKEKIAITGSVEAGNVLVDNKQSDSIATNVVKDRNIMAQDGLVVIHLMINVKSRKLNGQPDIVIRGINAPRLLRHLIKEITLNYGVKKINDMFEFKKEIKDFCRKEIRREIAKNPMIIPIMSTI